MNTEEKRYFVYTNGEGKALFIKKDIFDDLEISDSGGIIGESINKVLGIDEKQISDWIRQARSVGQLNNIQTDIQFLGVDKPRLVLLDFSVVVDDKNIFQGVDISIRIIDEPAEQIRSDSYSQAEENDEMAVLAAYFIERIIALRVMTLRMGGIKLGKGLDNLFNHLAANKSLEVRSIDGNIELDAAKKLKPQEMKELFFNLEEYIAGVTSSTLVNAVLDDLKSRTGQRNLEIVTRLLSLN